MSLNIDPREVIDLEAAQCLKRILPLKDELDILRIMSYSLCSGIENFRILLSRFTESGLVEKRGETWIRTESMDSLIAKKDYSFILKMKKNAEFLFKHV